MHDAISSEVPIPAPVPAFEPRPAAVGSDSPWPALVLQLAETFGRGALEAADVALRAACVMLPADGAVLIRWAAGGGAAIAKVGQIPEWFSGRPAEGAGWIRWSPLASVSLDPRTDLLVYRQTGRGFTAQDVRTLGVVATLLNWAGRGPGTTRGVVTGLAARVSASLRPEDVLLSSAEAASQLLRAEIAGVFLPSADDGGIDIRCVVGNTRTETARLRLRRGEGLAGRVYASGRGERADDYGTDPRSSPTLLALSDVEGTCSAMAVPMRQDDRTTGVLCVWRRNRSPFTDEDEALFQTLAELSAAALNNAQIHSVVMSRNDVLESEYRKAKERERLVERTLDIHTELTRIAMEGDDVAAVLRAVATRVGGSAAVVTDEGRALVSEDPATTWDVRRELAAWLAATAVGPAPGEVASVPAGDGWMLVTPLHAAGVTFGHLALARPAPPAAEDNLAAQQAAIASALVLAREDAAVTAIRRAQSEFVWDLLEGRIPDDVEAAVRATHIGAGFRLPARVVAVETVGLVTHAGVEGWSADRIERFRANLVRLITRRLDAPVQRHAVLASRADLFAVVVPIRKDAGDADRKLLAKTFRSVDWPPDLDVRVGISGRVEQARRLRNGWREARLALSAAPPHGYAAFEDLGVLQFLLAPTKREDLQSFANRRLGPLMEYDAEHGTDLIRTLTEFFAAECSARRTAERLFVHHRTVSYRLQRVEELTNLRMAVQEDRLEAQLALKVLALPSGEDGAEPDPESPQ